MGESPGVTNLVLKSKSKVRSVLGDVDEMHEGSMIVPTTFTLFWPFIQMSQ